MAVPSFVACKPIRIADVLAIGAAANVASATGGVMNETMPQYMMKRCTASGSMPAFTSGGANTMARKM